MRGDGFLDGNGFEVRTGRCGLVLRSDDIVNLVVRRFSEFIPVVLLMEEIDKVVIFLRLVIDVERPDVIGVIQDCLTVDRQSQE